MKHTAVLLRPSKAFYRKGFLYRKLSLPTVEKMFDKEVSIEIARIKCVSVGPSLPSLSSSKL